MHPILQTSLLKLYAACRRSGFMRTGFGRRAFAGAYAAYKLHLEGASLGSLRRHVAPGGTVIDVGANIGVFALRFAAWVGSGGMVLAIEPEDDNVAELRRRASRARLAPPIEVVSGAAAETSGTLHLAVNALHPGDHRLAPMGRPVPAHALDDLVAARGLAGVSLIKIDVQGAELRVLEGAMTTLRRFRPALYIEIDDEALAAQGASAAALEALLHGLGYRAFQWQRGAWVPVTSVADARTARAGLGYADYLFLAEEPKVDALSGPAQQRDARRDGV